MTAKVKLTIPLPIPLKELSNLLARLSDQYQEQTLEQSYGQRKRRVYRLDAGDGELTLTEQEDYYA